jgi:hypothetical protein
MTELIKILLEEMDLSSSILILILTLPIVATIVSFARHVIGLKTYGVYAPIALTYAYYELGIIGDSETSQVVQGIKYGLFLTLIVFFSAALVHLITRQIRLHFVPKMSLVLIGVVISVFIVMSAGALFGKAGLISINVLSLLLIILVAEQFINIYANKNGKTAISLGIQTVLLALVSYLLISWEAFQNFILDYPIYILLAAILINFLIGKWKGLRLSEIYRFWDILTSKPS